MGDRRRRDFLIADEFDILIRHDSIGSRKSDVLCNDGEVKVLTGVSLIWQQENVGSLYIYTFTPERLKLK